jgi:hypothetical protein
MKNTLRSMTLVGLFMLAVAALPLNTWACDGAGKSTHIGSLMSVNAAGKTFTIKDAQLNSPITFVASAEIIQALNDAKGSIMVNYEEQDNGKLTAVGVTF